MALIIVQSLIFLSLIISAYMIVVTLERCRSEKRYAFIYCILTILLYTLGYFIEISSGNKEGAVIAIKIMYAGACFMSPFFFFFVADYCELRIPKKRYFIPILIIPVLQFAVVFTFDQHQLLYASYFYDTTKTIRSMTVEPGPLYMINTFYPLFCVLLSCAVLIRSIFKQSRGRRFGLVLLLISALAPLIANFIYMSASFFFRTELAGINFTAFVMLISNFIFFYNVVRNDMFDLAPKAHAITIDLIRDSFIILDWDMSYMGSNKQAQDLFPALVNFQKGSSIENLDGWPAILSRKAIEIVDEEKNKQEMEFNLPHKEGKTYSGWTNPVTSESGAMLGWVIMIQDITETVTLIRSIQAQHDEIAAMRDNLKEGIFFMNNELRIQDSYSKAMEDVLSCGNLREKNFVDLLKASFSSKDMSIITDYFSMFMDNSADEELLEDINPLGEFAYISAETGEQKTLRCRFAPLDQGGGKIFIMGTIQDITAEVVLKKQLAEEEGRRHEEMRSFFEVMQVDQKIIVDFIEDTEYELNRAQETMQDNSINNKQKLISLYQSIHAVKSNALIIDLTDYGMKLHNFEEKIKILREMENEPDSADIEQITEELKKQIAGKDRIIEIIRRLSNFSQDTTLKRDDEIFIDSLKQACKRVASDENKKVTLIVEKFEKDALKHGPHRIMKEILTQLVRNAVYHGIESPEERLALGKNETGKIKIKIFVDGSNINMILSDDGQGLNFNRIAEKAKAKGLLRSDEDEKDNSFLTNLIFSPGFSTSDSENFHAGRGIGLNLVKDRLAEVNGKIMIQSKKSRGLIFKIAIPAG